MSDIGGGLFFKDVALNVMIYAYVFFFPGRGCRSLVRNLNMRKG